MADKVKAENNNDAINAKLDEVRELMVEDGMSEDSADALLGFARPSDGGLVVGNFADLQRMGMVAVEGKIVKNAMPADQDQGEVETSNLEDAFAEPPVQPTDEELSRQAGTLPSNTRSDEENAARASGGGSSTKAELLEQARAQGIEVNDSMTKAEIQEKLNA